MEGFEAEHGTCNSFDEPVVLFNDVVEIFRLHNADDPTNPRELEDDVDTLQSSKISATFVDDNALGDTVGGNGTLEKPAGCSRVAVLRQHEFKGLTVAVDRAVQICPFTTHSDVGFVSHLAGHCIAMAREGIRHEQAVGFFLACAFAAICGAYFTTQRFNVA